MRTNSLLYYSLLAALLPATAVAGIRVGNLSRNNAHGYQQVNELRYAATANAQAANAVNPIPVTAPIPVSNKDIESSIKNGDSNAAANMARLTNCSMIYPEGEFAWTTPTAGRTVGGTDTCTAIVEMRAIGAGPNGTDAVLARANIAAGDAVKCNISDFPETSWLPAAGQIEFPADQEPTIDDVVRVMNAEQKQNAGLKIAAGAIIGGLGGNATGKNEPGHDGLLGGGKSKTNNTIIGALGGAALMAGNAYTGKVAGDTILSAGVNAAAGAVIGNIAASGDSVMRIEACTIGEIDTTCLWGFVEEVGSLGKGETAYISATNIGNFKICKDNRCEYKDLNIDGATIAGYDVHTNSETGKTNSKTSKTIDIRTIFKTDRFDAATDKYCFKNNQMISGWLDCEDAWVKLGGNVSVVSKRVPAMVVNVRDKVLGWKKSDWEDFFEQHKDNDVVGRTGVGVATNLSATEHSKKLSTVKFTFTPVYQDATDGGIIDLSNKARAKDTLAGAGVGAGLGAFAGYQGAQKDVEDRWVTAVREYKDSLQKIYCVTGKRFLSHYNDMVIIPAPREE